MLNTFKKSCKCGREVTLLMADKVEEFDHLPADGYIFKPQPINGSKRKVFRFGSTRCECWKWLRRSGVPEELKDKYYWT